MSAKGSKRSTRSTRPASTSSTPPNLWLAAVLAVATIVAYANCFSSPFVLDDQGAIVDNPTIHSLTPLSQALSGPIQSSTAGRPLINLSFAVNYAVNGLDPRGYHAVNLLLHVLCGLVLFGIIRRTLSNVDDGSNLRSVSNLFAFSCSVLWMLHPLQTEVVDYVTQRTESSMALAYLVTLYAFIRGVTSDRGRLWFGLAIVCCALGALCKESIVTAPVMVLLYDAVFCAGSIRAAWQRRGVLYAGLALSWIVLALVAAGARSHSAGFSSGVTAWTYLLNQAPLLVRYLRLTIWPASLVLDYGLPKTLTLRTVLPSALLIAGLMAVAVAMWRFNRRLAYLATWCFVTLAPTSSIVPIATEVGAERRMYLPLAAIAVLVVSALFKTMANRRAIAAVIAVMSLCLGVVTLRRNADYHDLSAMWRQVIDRYPHGRAHHNYGLLLKDAGRRDEAIHEYEIAASDFPDAEYALGFELLNDHRYEEAAVRLRRYLELRPLNVDAIKASNLLGRALLASGHSDEALARYRDTLRMQPRNPDAMSGIGESELKRGRYEEAAAAFRSSLQQSAGDATVHFNLGFALMQLRRFDEAAVAFSDATRLNPRDPAAHGNLAATLAELGRLDDAIAEFHQAVAVESDPAAREEIRQVVQRLEAEKKGAGQR